MNIHKVYEIKVDLDKRFENNDKSLRSKNNYE